MENNRLIELYLQDLSTNEKKAIEIAKSHLESSFCLEKSNGFLKFKQDYLSKQT
tara:strand:+ start:223 stop:384 length:162 start_codon:yes stop_codon:yes gene_type:complete